jgi:ubiquinone/menaquinone biosynthesis C-methylase UbiE
MKYIESQFGNPRGLIGHLVGLIMAYENRARNQWALSLLNIQPTDRILEIGFGSGWAIQQANRLVTRGLVAGVDRSMTMVQQATIRNRAGVRSGRVILQHGSATEIPFGDGIFNKVYAVNSFHEWEKASRGLQEVKRVLISGDTLLIVEHPHGTVTVEGIKALGDHLREQLQSVGFKSVQIYFNSIQGRAAVGVKGERT